MREEHETSNALLVEENSELKKKVHSTYKEVDKLTSKESEIDANLKANDQAMEDLVSQYNKLVGDKAEHDAVNERTISKLNHEKQEMQNKVKVVFGVSFFVHSCIYTSHPLSFSLMTKLTDPSSRTDNFATPIQVTGRQRR